jgi:hypothetical protein
MDQIAKRYAQDDAFREVADLLFGEGHELIHKANPDQSDLSARRKKSERRQAQVGFASNVVGLGAGAMGVKDTAKDWNQKRKVETGGTLTPKSIKVSRGTKVAAGAALGLQVANIGGDVVANRVLARSAKKDTKKKPDMIHKDIREIPEGAQLPRTKGQLTAAVATKGSDRVVAASRGTFKRLPEKIKTSRKKQVKKSAEFDVKWEGEISKVDSDKRQVFGWASIVEMNGEPVVDLQGDYIAIDEVEKSAYEYVHKSRKGGDMHLRNEFGEPKVGSHMIESFVVTEDKKEALGLPPETPTGWWVGYQVNDDELWGKVKSGERTGFSIHGRGIRSA